MSRTEVKQAIKLAGKLMREGKPRQEAMLEAWKRVKEGNHSKKE